MKLCKISLISGPGGGGGASYKQLSSVSYFAWILQTLCIKQSYENGIPQQLLFHEDAASMKQSQINSTWNTSHFKEEIDSFSKY